MQKFISSILLASMMMLFFTTNTSATDPPPIPPPKSCFTITSGNIEYCVSQVDGTGTSNNGYSFNIYLKSDPTKYLYTYTSSTLPAGTQILKADGTVKLTITEADTTQSFELAGIGNGVFLLYRGGVIFWMCEGWADLNQCKYPTTADYGSTELGKSLADLRQQLIDDQWVTPIDKRVSGWFTGGTFQFDIEEGANAATNNYPAPYIDIAGTADGTRPNLKFTLKHVTRLTGTSSGEDNLFYFCVSHKDNVLTTNYDDTCLIIDMNGNVDAYLHALVGSPTQTLTNWKAPGSFVLNNKATGSYLSLIVNRVYSPRADSNKCEGMTPPKYPDLVNPLYTQANRLTFGEAGMTPGDKTGGQFADCLYHESNGWLAHWGVDFNNSAISNPTGEGDDDVCGKNTVCKDANGKTTKGISCAISQGLCSVGYTFYNWFKDMLMDAQKGLENAIGFGNKCD